MGSTPSSQQQKKDKVNVVEITAVEILQQDDNNNVPSNKKQPSPITKNKLQKAKQNINNNNEQFTTSIQQMKFSKRNDIFKQRSKQTQMQLNIALTSLKKNQLLSTVEFKRLQKTQHLTHGKKQQQQNTTTLIANNNAQRKDRYHYKKAINKRSQLAVREKRTQSSINVSSLTSTYINQGLVQQKSNQRDYDMMMRKQNKHNNKRLMQQSSQPQIIVELLMKKRQLNNLSNKNNKYYQNQQNHQQQQKQHVKSQHVNRRQQYNQNIEYSDKKQVDSINNNNNNDHNYNNNLKAQYEQIDIQQVYQLNNNNKNIDMNKKKKSKFVKSQKFITNNLSDKVFNQWHRDGVIVLDQIQER